MTLETEKEISEENLIEMIKAGGHLRNEALKRMMDWTSVFASIRKYVLNNSGQMLDAKNMFVEAVIVLDRKTRKGEFELSGSLKGYISNTAKLLWKNQLRKKREAPLDDSKHDQAVYDPEIEKEESLEGALLRKAWKKISARCQHILKLWQLDYPMDEIALELQLSSSAMAKKLKYQCLKSLKDIIHNK